MVKADGWRKNGVDSMPVYEFLPPKTWRFEKIKIESQKIKNQIESSVSTTGKETNGGWIGLFHELPLCLKRIILYEISNGNNILRIGKTGWPHPQSVVVSLGNRFHTTSRIFCPNVRWRLLDDPHYCREEISEFMNEIEYLIIV
jgi:hypothetical protein